MSKEILLGLTTTHLSDWRRKLRNIEVFDLHRVALFATGIGKFEREELYQKLEMSQIEEIPHVHARDDFTKEEMDYLVERFGVKLFNIHATKECEYFLEMEEHLDRIFVENMTMMSQEVFDRFVEKCAGVCIDFSHWESFKKKFPHKKYGDFKKVLETHKVGCCHVSGVKRNPFEIEESKRFSVHFLDDLCELDYMKKYVDYLPKYISLELENSFEEQLQAKRYLEKIIDKYKA